MSCAFNLDVCNMLFSVSCIYPSTMRYCEGYLSDRQGYNFLTDEPTVVGFVFRETWANTKGVKNMSCAFNLDVCNMLFSVSCIYPSTMRYCEDYLSDRQGTHVIAITQSDIDAERENCIKEEAGVDPSLLTCSDSHMEIITLLRKIADYITQYNRALMHGSAICVDGKAYIFTALSGTGKSTHTALLRKLLGDRCTMILSLIHI